MGLWNDVPRELREKMGGLQQIHKTAEIVAADENGD